MRRPRHVLITLNGSALTGLTVTPDCWWDVLNSSVLLAHSRTLPDFPYRTWARSALSSLAGTPAADLVRWCGDWPRPYVPAFLTTRPEGQTGIAAAIALFRNGDPQQVRQRLLEEFPHSTPPPFQNFVTDPDGAIADLCAKVEDYFAVALQQWWPAVTAAVDEDVTFRGQVVTTGGISAVLSQLHPRVTWTHPTMSIAATGHPEVPEECSRIVLTPLMFAQDRVMVNVGHDGTVQLGYQSRGAAGLLRGAARAGKPEESRLALLFGRTRAAVFRELLLPCTTTALAGRLDLAPSTVSEHLNMLVTLRVACRQRAANRVYYELTPSGRQLLGAFGGDDD